MLNNTRKTALTAILCAISVVIMYIGSLLGKTDIAAAVIASFCVSVALAEFGYKRALSVYAVTAVISLILAPSKTAAALFTAFFGYYPVLKTYVECRFEKARAYICKYIVMNAALAVLVSSAMFFTKIPIPVILVVFVAANAVLPIYDFAFAFAMNFYYERIRRR